MLKREGGASRWRMRWTELALALAIVVAGCVASVFVLSLLGGLASADAASRATLLARAISYAINAMAGPCVLALPTALTLLAWRMWTRRKAKGATPPSRLSKNVDSRRTSKHSMRRSALLWSLVFVLFVPARAGASAAPPRVVHQRDPIPTVAVEGDLQVMGGAITIACGLSEFVDAWATCTIDATLHLSTDGGARLTREPTEAPPTERAEPPSPTEEGVATYREPTFVVPDTHPSDWVTLAGREFTGVLAMPPGASRTLVIRATRSFHASLDSNEYLTVSPPLTRHPFLSESHAFDFGADRVDVTLLRGDAHITGPVHFDARSTAGVVVELGGQRVADARPIAPGETPLNFSITLTRERDYEGPLASGGLVLHGATRENLDVAGEGRALYAVEYELIFQEFVFASVGVATDLESLFQSLVLEAATPMVLLIPSLAAGVGVVVRELGTRPADAALRFRLGASLPSLGANVDLDYWPDLGQWTATLGLRIGL